MDPSKREINSLPFNVERFTLAARGIFHFSQALKHHSINPEHCFLTVECILISLLPDDNNHDNNHSCCRWFNKPPHWCLFREDMTSDYPSTHRSLGPFIHPSSRPPSPYSSPRRVGLLRAPEQPYFMLMCANCRFCRWDLGGERESQSPRVGSFPSILQANSPLGKTPGRL